ncbi:hypothetical protein D9M68_995890 [compost metagenome]
MTSEPFCCTWLPSTSRRALCIRWVALWLRTVAARSARFTLAVTVSPTASVPCSIAPWWPNTSALIFCVSPTVKRAEPLVMTPSSPT